MYFHSWQQTSEREVCGSTALVFPIPSKFPSLSLTSCSVRMILPKSWTNMIFWAVPRWPKSLLKIFWKKKIKRSPGWKLWMYIVICSIWIQNVSLNLFPDWNRNNALNTLIHHMMAKIPRPRPQQVYLNQHVAVLGLLLVELATVLRWAWVTSKVYLVSSGAILVDEMQTWNTFATASLPPWSILSLPLTGIFLFISAADIIGSLLYDCSNMLQHIQPLHYFPEELIFYSDHLFTPPPLAICLKSF